MSTSSIMKRVWDKQKTSWLVLAFTVGFYGHLISNYQKRKTRCDEVKSKYDEYVKRNDEYFDAMMSLRLDDPKSSS